MLYHLQAIRSIIFCPISIDKGKGEPYARYMDKANSLAPFSVEAKEPKITKHTTSIIIAIIGVILIIIVLASVLVVLTNKKTPVLKTIPIPRPPEASLFNELSNEGKQYFTELSKNILRLEYIPSALTVEPVKNDKGKIISPNNYSGTWVKDNIYGNFSISFRDVGIVNSAYIELIVPQKLSTINAVTASATASTYYTLKPKGTWVCKQISATDTSIMHCENFWIDTNSTKKGIGVIAAPQPNIYYCEISPTSDKFSQNSCYSFKSK